MIDIQQDLTNICESKCKEIESSFQLPAYESVDEQNGQSQLEIQIEYYAAVLNDQFSYVLLHAHVIKSVNEPGFTDPNLPKSSQIVCMCLSDFGGFRKVEYSHRFFTWVKVPIIVQSTKNVPLGQCTV